MLLQLFRQNLQNKKNDEELKSFSIQKRVVTNQIKCFDQCLYIAEYLNISANPLNKENGAHKWFLMHKECMPPQQNFQMRSFANVAHC